MTVVGVVLAAGASTRFGSPKQLFDVDGEPMLRRVVREALASRCARVAVVLGANSDVVEPVLAGLAVDIVRNPDWADGMSTSVRAAVAWAEAQACDGVLLMVGDQPRLRSAHLDALIAAFAGAPVGSAYAGTIGVPAIVPRGMFGEAKRIEGDRGARALLRGGGAIAWADGEHDVDR